MDEEIIITGCKSPRKKAFDDGYMAACMDVRQYCKDHVESGAPIDGNEYYDDGHYSIATGNNYALWQIRAMIREMIEKKKQGLNGISVYDSKL